jgi:hypothetical protein
MEEKRNNVLVYHREEQYKDLAKTLKTMDLKDGIESKLNVKEVNPNMQNDYDLAAKEVNGAQATKYKAVFTDCLFVAKCYKKNNPTGILIRVTKPSNSHDSWEELSDVTLTEIVNETEIKKIIFGV